jgi:hypothetical protein
LAAAGSSLDRHKIAAIRAIAAMQFDEQCPRDDACCNPGTGSELRTPNPAAQTRLVSGGPFGQTKRRFS